MTPAPPPLQRSAPAVPESIGRLRSAVDDFARAAGAVDGVRASVKLAVSEALTNAVLHAYVDAPQPGEVAVHGDVEGSQLVVAVSDRGRGLRPRSDSPGLGLGLPLLAQLADEVSLLPREDGPGTVALLRFDLDGAAT